MQIGTDADRDVVNFLFSYYNMDNALKKLKSHSQEEISKALENKDYIRRGTKMMTEREFNKAMAMLSQKVWHENFKELSFFNMPAIPGDEKDPRNIKDPKELERKAIPKLAQIDLLAINNYKLLIQNAKMGRTKFRWQAIIDDVTRPYHKILDGKTFLIADALELKLNAPFPGCIQTKNGEIDPGESMNCRCTMIFS